MTLLTGKTKLRAFTLVEIMVSVVILGVGLSFIINSYMLSIKGLNSSANIVSALNLAREKMQELELLSLGRGLVASSSAETIRSGVRDYGYSQELSEIAQAPEEISKNLLQACLKVNWSEQKITKNVALSAYFAKEKQQ